MGREWPQNRKISGSISDFKKKILWSCIFTRLLDALKNLVKTQLQLNRNGISERISFNCAQAILNVKVVSKYKNSSCLITVRFLRSPIYSGRPSCLPIYLQGRRKVHKFSRILTDCLFMFLFLNWEKMGGGQESRRALGDQGGPKVPGGYPWPPSSTGPDLV